MTWVRCLLAALHIATHNQPTKQNTRLLASSFAAFQLAKVLQCQRGSNEPASELASGKPPNQERSQKCDIVITLPCHTTIAKNQEMCRGAAGSKLFQTRLYSKAVASYRSVWRSTFTSLSRVNETHTKFSMRSSLSQEETSKDRVCFSIPASRIALTFRCRMWS